MHWHEAQVAHLTHLSLSYRTPSGEVQRARLLCLAPRHPEWTNTEIAHAVGCCRDTVTGWRRRWCQEPTIHSALRLGAPRRLPPVVRAPVIALACTTPHAHGNVWKRWSGAQLAQVAVEHGLVEAISPTTIRRWRRQDTIKPWRYHRWQKATDPALVANAPPGLDLDAHPPAWAEAGEVVCGVDEKTSIPARQRVSETRAAVPAQPMPGADRYRRMGALPRCGTLMVARGLTCARGRATRGCAAFKACWIELLTSSLGQRLKVLPLLLDHGSTQAPKPLGTWMASLALAVAGRLYWRPTPASG